MAQSPAWRSHPVAVTLGALLLVLVAAVAVCEWRGWPFLRAPIERALSQRLDRDVELGPGFRLHLIGPLRVRGDLLKIGPPKWGGEGDRFVEARELYLELPWSTVWNVAVAKKAVPLRIAALDVGSFDAVLWRREDGRANWQLGAARQQKPAAQFPEFGRLMVRNGRLSLDDAPSGLRLSAEAQTREGAAAGTDAGLSLQGRGRYRKGEFDFNIQSNGVLPLVAPEGAGTAVPLTLRGRTPEGRVAFDGQARDIIHLQALQGHFALSGSSLASVAEPFGVTLPTTAPFRSEGALSKAGDVWQADIARLEVGSSRLAGKFSFDRRSQVPLLSGVLRGARLDLRDLAPAFGSPAGRAPNPAKPADHFFPDREFDIPSLQAMNADVRVDLQLADLHTALLQPFDPLQGHILLRDGVLKVEQLNARTAGGSVQGLLTLDGRAPKRPRWSGDLKLDGVRLEQWLQLHNEQAKPENSATAGLQPAMRYVSGRMGGHLQFTGTGRSVADMASSLDGTLAAWVNDGEISHLAMEAAGLDLAQAIGVVVRGDDALPMQCAVTQFTARGGELHADVAMIDSRDTTLIVSGDISLAREQLALTAQAYPKDFSPVALRSPIHLEGRFSKPQVRLDKKPLAAKAAAAVALGVVNPLAALIPLVDPGKKAPMGCQQAMDRLRGGVKGVEPPKVQTAGTEQALPKQRAR